MIEYIVYDKEIENLLEENRKIIRIRKEQIKIFDKNLDEIEKLRKLKFGELKE